MFCIGPPWKYDKGVPTYDDAYTSNSLREKLRGRRKKREASVVEDGECFIAATARFVIYGTPREWGSGSAICVQLAFLVILLFRYRTGSIPAGR